MANAKSAAAAIISDHVCFLVRMYIPLEVKVKTNEQFAGIDVCGRQSKSRPGSVLVQPVVLVVPGESRPADHKRVVAVTDGVSGDVAEVGWNARRGLLRHSDRLITPDEDQLRAVYVMRLDQDAIPGRRSRSRRQSRAWKV